MPAVRVENGYSNLPAMQPKPLIKCKQCGYPTISGESDCPQCAKPDKGVTPDASISPLELYRPRPELEGGKK